jgi:Tfp pilus assembly protein PilF
LRADYASFLIFDGRFEEAMENNDLVRKLGSTRFESAAVWLNRSIVALAEGNNAQALEAINRAMFINQNIYHTPAAVAILYVAGDRAAAPRLYNEMRQSYPDLSPRNPLLYTYFKPIDDILARQRELGEVDGPADSVEIYRVLSQN